MARIYLVLAVIAMGLLSGTLIQGYFIGDTRVMAAAYKNAQADLDKLERQLRTSNDEEHRAALQQARDRLSDVAEDFRPMQRQMSTHFLVGLLATMVTVLVNSISVTYFIGTGRWCKEVVDTYELDQSLWQETRVLKRRTFPWSLGSVIAILVIVCLGAVADPAGPARAGTGNWTIAHATASYLGIAFIGWSFLVQVASVGRNYDVIARILKQVNQIRASQQQLP